MTTKRAFDEAYEYTMQKLAASCCGGRGGQTMIRKHGGGANPYDSDPAFGYGKGGKEGVMHLMNDRQAQNYKKLLKQHGWDYAPDEQTAGLLSVKSYHM